MREIVRSFWPFGVIGLLLLVLGALIEWVGLRHFLALIVMGFGLAFLVAIIIAGMYEWHLRRGALDDVVKASVGYMVPEPVRDEMEWVYGLHLFTTLYRHEFTVEPLNDDIIELTEVVHLDVENQGSRSEDFRITRTLDERHYPKQRSKIVSVGYSRGGEPVEFSGGNLSAYVDYQGWAYLFNYPALEEKPLVLAPEEKISVWSKSIQVRRLSDRENLVLALPTVSPEITVKIPDSFNFVLEVQHRQNLKRIGDGCYRLEGTLLPYQGISFRWWPAQPGAKGQNP